MMYGNFYNNFGFMHNAFYGFLLIPLMVWSIVWKGYALWTAAKKDSKPWFIALLVINTMGILEILYIYVFSKDKTSKKVSKKK